MRRYTRDQRYTNDRRQADEDGHWADHHSFSLFHLARSLSRKSTLARGAENTYLADQATPLGFLYRWISILVVLSFHQSTQQDLESGHRNLMYLTHPWVSRRLVEKTPGSI